MSGTAYITCPKCKVPVAVSPNKSTGTQFVRCLKCNHNVLLTVVTGVIKDAK
jgi:hypothetical protein